MLYISRMYRSGNYGVVDTDDGVEEQLAGIDLIRTVRSTKLDIKGLKLLDDFTVEYIHPYQVPEKKTVLQTKLEMLTGIQLVVYQNNVVSIQWDDSKIKQPVPIRVSDFGDSLWDCVFHGNREVHHHVVELIIDDKVKYITPSAFKLSWGVASLGLPGYGVILNLSELTNDRLAEAIYKSIASYVGNPFNSVVDDERRMREMARR